MLFVVVRTGADPILDAGGGELALETDAEGIEASSENISLAGVPGRSNFAIDARLGWRRFGGNIEDADDGVAVGVSAFGVDVTLNVFGARGAGDCAREAVLGGSGGNAAEDEAIAFFAGESGIVTVGLDGTEILRMPGVERLSTIFCF